MEWPKGTSIIHKLIRRETNGTFGKRNTPPVCDGRKLFEKAPARMRFCLKSIIEDMGNHILMGNTQCGRFLLTYTFTMDNEHSTNRLLFTGFKYKLHWWTFSPGNKAVMVAEVHLFENQDVYEMLAIGIAQWPTIHNKILVYGHSNSLQDDVEYRTLFVTVTSMPTLDNCADCVAVKNSFQNPCTMNHDRNENAAAGSRCLKHGLTVHTMFNIYPPYPTVIMPIAMKYENRIIINVGTCLHAFSVDFEENSKTSNVRVPKRMPDESTVIVNETIHYRLGAEAIAKGFNYKIPAANNSESFLSSSKNKQKNRLRSRKCSSLQNSDCDVQYEKSECDDAQHLRTSKRTRCSPVPLLPSKVARLRQLANKVYDFADSEDKVNLKYKWYRRRTIADKMYEFCSDEEDMENIHPLTMNLRSSESIRLMATSSTQNQAESRLKLGIDLDDSGAVLEAPNIDASDTQLSSPLELPGSYEKGWFRDNEAIGNSGTGGYVNKLNSKFGSGSSQLTVTCESLLSDWETMSPSPRSDISHTTGEEPSTGRTFLENLPRMSPTPFDPAHHCANVKCYPAKEREALALKSRNMLSSGSFASSSSYLAGSAKAEKKEPTIDRCTIRDVSSHFERRFVEVDEEILSTITDADDDDGMTGFQYVFPLSVHGTDYNQMQMVMNNKIEKLNVPHCIVKQDSLDIEQLSYKAAVIVCKCQEFRFWFCSDYDAEIIDICALNGDVLALVFIRLNAEPINPTNQKDKQGQSKDTRRYYETRCLFIWNANSGSCWLEAYTPLVEGTALLKQLAHTSMARIEADKFYDEGLGFFDMPLIKPIRHFEHMVMDCLRGGPSLDVIEDELNLICFYRNPEESDALEADSDDSTNNDEETSADDSDYDSL